MTRILIVDDKEDNLYYLEALLTGHGYTVESARHGAEALVKARLNPPDAVVSDLLMPVMDGYTLLRLWKSDAKLRQIPFIVYTATYTEPADERLAMRLGADGFILKPAEPEAFLARLREVQASTLSSPPKSSTSDETEVLRVYSETLIRKLEEKTLQLEESNRALQKDIAGRKKTEEALRLLNSAVLQATESVLITDADLNPPGPKIIFVNPAFTAMTGYSAGEVIGQSPRILQGPKTDPALLSRLRQNLECGEIFEGEAIQYKKDGSEYFQEWQIAPLRDHTGQITHFVAIQRDITGRKLAQEELLTKTTFLEAIVETSPDGIIVVDHHGRKILQSQRMADLWKIPPELANEQNDARQIDFVARQTKDPAAFLRKIAELNSEGDQVSRDEVHLLDGRIFDRFSAPVRDRNGRHYGQIWSFRDITEQRKLEAQFRQAQKMEAFGQLAGGVAHDFNNILAVIQLQASLLKAEPNLSLPQLEFADGIEKAAQRAANLTRQLLLFSRQKNMQPHDLDLKEIVENMSKMLQRTLGEHIRIRFNLFKEPLFVHADAGMIDQILLNLAVNARDAMAEGGHLTIETMAVELDAATAAHTPQARAGSFACLCVTDTGTGIPRDVLPRIFEPFFTTKEIGKGTGLGLATVFGIVQQHKGWISVCSDVGRGTSFKIYFPRLSHAPEKGDHRLPDAAVQGGNETILLVEDEVTLRQSTRIVLTRLGYRVLEAADGAQALKIWLEAKGEIRLLLTDLVMPGELNGRRLAQQLLLQNAKLPVVYLSGYGADFIGTDEALKEGVNYLPKPFDPNRLAKVIRENLDK